MSKYKYSSQLSSQYRRVFKSYHSLDRYEEELKGNSSSKNIKQNQPNYHTNSFKPTYYQKNPYMSKITTQPNLGIQTNHVHNQSNFNYSISKAQRLDFDKKYNSTSKKHFRTQSYEQYKSKIRKSDDYQKYSYLNNQPQIFTTNLKKIQTTQNLPLQYKNKINQNQYLYRNQRINNQLKMKVQDINKKRNQLKLKVRINENQRSKYNQNINKAEKIRQKYKINSNQAKVNAQVKAPTQVYEKRKVLCESDQTNINKNNLKNQDNYFIKSKNQLSSVKRQQQYLKTPHFYDENTYHQTSILVTKPIHNPLDGLVRHTITQRI